MTTNTTVKLGAGSTYNAASDALIFGSTGAEIVKIFDGVTVTTDSSVERVEFSRASSEYTFKATNTGLQVSYSGKVVANVVSGEKLAFSNGSAVVASTFDATTATGAITLNGTVVPTTDGKLTALIPNNAAGEASTATITPTPTPTGDYTLSSSTSSVTEGDVVTFTVTAATAVAAATTFSYQVVGTAVGTTVNAAANTDFSSITGTVTIAAGAKTGTFTVTPASDGLVEGYEGFKVSLLDTSFNTIATSSPVVVNDIASNGRTDLLNAGADVFTGTAGNDTFNALTVKADGTASTTFSAFDSIDGGAGTDTLNLYSDNTNNINDTFSSTIEVKNIEIINIYNANAAAGVFGDASKYAGVTTLNQVGFADNVTKLATTTTAAFKTVDSNISVSPTDTATSVAIALDNYGEGSTITVNGSAAAATLNAVSISGSVKDTDANSDVAAITVAVTTGKDVESLTVNTAVKTTVTATENGNSAAAKDVRTIDFSSSTGKVTFTGGVTNGTANSVSTIKGGSNDDTLTITTATLKDDATTTTVETVSASIEGGAGNDSITINTSGTGTTTADAGNGNDTVTLTADGTGVLTVKLGDGNDSFKGAGAVAGTDSIDGGNGTDSLLLNMVGSANIGAFTNFENFDAAGLAKTLDVDILATKNTVTEFVASADVGGTAILTNVGAGVGYRVTGDTTVSNALTLTQKTAGALTVTLDIDEASTITANTDSGAAANKDAAVIASNATSVKTVFDSAFKDAAVDSTDNLTNLTITGTKATSLEIVSGGAFAINDLAYTSGDDATAGKGDLLTSVTISGDRPLSFAVTESTTTELTTVNASAMTGALTFALNDIKATGTLTLGSGDDVVTAQTGLAAAAGVAADAASVVDNMRVISGIKKGTAENSTIQSSYDVIKLTNAVQAADIAATATHTVKDGLFTFNGAGASTLAAAVQIVVGAIAVNEAVVFEFIGNSYIFAEGSTDGGVGDVLIKLTGVTGLTGLDDVNAAGTNLYVF